MRPEHLADGRFLVRAEEDQIALFDLELGGERGLFRVAEKLHDGRFPFTVFDLDERQTFRAVGLCGLRQFFDLAGGDPREPLRVDGLDDPARVQRATENLEAARRERAAEVGQFQAETGVGLVAAEAVHGVGVGQSREGRRYLDSEGFLEHGGQHALDQRDDVVRRDEARFNIHLGKLQLPVGAQVFVAEALGDLKIFLQARDHEQLFVLLRGLRQRVERSGLQARRHEKIARPLGRALGKDGRLDFEEPGVVEVIAHGFDDAMALAQVALHAGAAQVEVTVREAQVFVADFLVEREGRHLGLVEHGQRVGDEFDFAGGQRGVGLAFQTRRDLAGDGDDILRAQPVRLPGDGGVFLGPEDDLRDAGAVAQVDEDDAAVVAARIDPAGEGNGLAHVGGAELVARVCTVAAHGRRGLSGPTM